MLLLEDKRWQSWWRGHSRPVLVVAPAIYREACLHEFVGKCYPGTLVIESKMLPLT